MDCVTAWLKSWFSDTSDEVLIYLVAIVLYTLTIIAKIYSYEQVSWVLIWVASVFMVSGLFIFLKPKLVQLWGSVIGKFVLTILTFLGTTISLSLASQAINSSLGVTSAPFVYTQSIVALLISPLVILVILSISVFVMLTIAIPLFIFKDIDFSIKGLLMFVFLKDGSSVDDVGMLRVIALVVLLFICSSLLEKSSDYTELVTGVSRWYAFNLEMEVHSYCNTPEGVRVAYINSDLIITASHDEHGYIFKTESCDKTSGVVSLD